MSTATTSLWLLSQDGVRLAGWLGTAHSHSRLDAAAPATQSVAVDTADHADIQASLRGDGDAFARLVGRHQDAVALRMRRFARDHAARQELVHDVFVEVYFSLPSYRATAPFPHWLNRIATRVGYHHWKRKRSRPTHLELAKWDPADGRTPPDEASTAADELHGLLEQLPARDRLVLTLLYLEEHSVAQAADLAGWSQTMVKVQAYRARAKLRRLLQARSGNHPDGLEREKR